MEGAAADLVAWDDHSETLANEYPNGGLVDVGVEEGHHAAREEGHAGLGWTVLGAADHALGGEGAIGDARCQLY